MLIYECDGVLLTCEDWRVSDVGVGDVPPLHEHVGDILVLGNFTGVRSTVDDQTDETRTRTISTRRALCAR